MRMDGTVLSQVGSSPVGEVQVSGAQMHPTEGRWEAPTEQHCSQPPPHTLGNTALRPCTCEPCHRRGMTKAENLHVSPSSRARSRRQLHPGLSHHGGNARGPEGWQGHPDRHRSQTQ